MKYGCLGVFVLFIAVLIVVVGLAFVRGGLHGHSGRCALCITSGQLRL